jgi:hypothetical protein
MLAATVHGVRAGEFDLVVPLVPRRNTMVRIGPELTLIPHGCYVAGCPDRHMSTDVDVLGERVRGFGGCRAVGVGSLGSPGRWYG